MAILKFWFPTSGILDEGDLSVKEDYKGYFGKEDYPVGTDVGFKLLI